MSFNQNYGSQLTPNVNLRLLLLGLAYFALWLLTRFDAISANVLFFDDYLNYVDHSKTIVDYVICQVPAKDYRWIFQGIACATTTYFPWFALSVLPKLAAGFFISGFSVVLFVTLRLWAVPTKLALILPLVVLSHPTVNEITLWNTASLFALWMFVCAVSFHLLSQDSSPTKQAIAIAGLFIVSLAYEIYLIVFLVFVFAQPFVCYLTKAEFDVRRSLKLCLLFGLISGVYIAQVKLTNLIFGQNTGLSRSFVEVHDIGQFLVGKLQSMSNILANVFMTPLSYYTKIEFAWGFWKWLPIGLIVSTGVVAVIARRGILTTGIVMAFVVVILLLPSSPILISEQSPESWRISVPSLVAFCLGLLPLILSLGNLSTGSAAGNKWEPGPIMAFCIPLAIILLQTPASIAESKLRVAEYQQDEAIVWEIRTYWQKDGASPDQYRVGVLSGLQLHSPRISNGAQNLTTAFHARGVKSAFNTDFAWRGKLLYAGFRVVELEADTGSSFTNRYLSKCDTGNVDCDLVRGIAMRDKCARAPSFIDESSGFRLVHSKTTDQYKNIIRTTAICT